MPQLAPFPYVIDPCPECGAPISDLKMENYIEPVYLSPLNIMGPESYVTSYDYNAKVRISLGPCGHYAASADYIAEVDKNGKQITRIKLTSLWENDETPVGRFRKAVISMFGQMNGWSAGVQFDGAAYALRVEAHCPHGGTAVEMVSKQMVEYASPPPEYLAEDLARRMDHMCKSSHENFYPSYQNEPMHYYGQKSAGPYAIPPYYPQPAMPAMNAGDPSSHPTVAALIKIVPALKTAKGSCPECPRDQNTFVANVIVHLNDHHRWTREQIADWLDLLDIELPIQRKEVA